MQNQPQQKGLLQLNPYKGWAKTTENQWHLQGNDIESLNNILKVIIKKS